MKRGRDSQEACFLIKKWKELRKYELMIQQRKDSKRRDDKARKIRLRSIK